MSAHSQGLFFISWLLLSLAGCTAPDVATVPGIAAPAPQVVVTPMRVKSTPATELAEPEVLSRPSIRRGKPLPRTRRPVARSPQDVVVFQSEDELPKGEKERPSSVSAVAKATEQQPPADNSTPEPDYPKAEKRPTGQAASHSRSPKPSRALSSRVSEDQDESEFFEFSNEIRARPIYAPVITYDNLEPVRAMYAKKEVMVRFDLSPNGRFKVMLLEGTGDPELDQIALETLRQWRWSPKTVSRRPVGSIEILTLHARVL